jgi:hypothetical protein
MPDLVGRTLGQYRIVEQVGLGGMATVYKAYQPALDRYVAIKVLPAYYAHEPGFAERFTREAKAVARLAHPHVLPIYDFGQEDGLSYIVMQYVQAGTLKDVLGRPLGPATAADIVEQVADALDYAHEQSVIHRDVKPSNVLMDRGRWVLLSDFGLAKMVEGSVQLTGSGVGVGTPAYVAPEQGRGLPVDRRADIYSLGIVLYEMVTGRVPFEAETPMAVVVKHITEPLPLPRAANPALPEPVERVILKALAKNPEDRYETAGKLAAALRKALAGLDGLPASPAAATAAGLDLDEGATQVVPSPMAQAGPARKSVSIWGIGAGLVVLLLLLAGGVGLARLRANRLARLAADTPPGVTAPAPVDGAEPFGQPPIAGTQAGSSQGPAPGETPPLPAPLPRSREEVLQFIKETPPAFQDDFGDPGSGWKTAEDEHGRLGYQDGGYVIHVPGGEGRQKGGVTLPLAQPLGDFVLRLDLAVVKGGPGANWVVEFRQRSDDRWLYAGLSAQPRGFSIGYLSPQEEVPLERGLALDYRAFQATEVTLLALGPDLELYLDGQRVGAARTDLLEPGPITFQVINTGDPAVAYRLDNVRVWTLDAPGVQPPPPGSGPPSLEDFEDGRADGWRLEPGWKLVQEEGDNHVLVAERHSMAYVEGVAGPDVRVRFRAKPLDRDLLFNFSLEPGEVGRLRYVAHLMPDLLALHRFTPDDQGPVVAEAPIAYTAGEWHQVELVLRGGHIEILLDDRRVLTYDDPEPLPPGRIAFENGDPPAHQMIDDVLVEPLHVD